MNKTTVANLSELHAIIPSSCNQVAAVFNNGFWEVTYFFDPVPEEKVVA